MPVAAVVPTCPIAAPVPAPKEDLALQNIRDLDDASFAIRQKAQKDLIAMGELVRPHLEKALTAADASSETKRRLGDIIKRLEVGSLAADHLRGLRAIETLEWLGSPAGLEILHNLAKGAPGSRLTEEAQTALDRKKTAVRQN